MPDPLVAAAVGTGIPVCVFPVHRRSEVDYFAVRGVQGFVTSSYGYVAGAVAQHRRERIRDRLAAFVEAGVTTLSVAPYGPSMEHRRAIVRTMAEVADEAGLG